MNTQQIRSSWGAFALFYLILLAIISILDWVNGLFSLPYWGTQVGLLTLGVVILAALALWWQDLSAARGVLLAFTVGILTIIPAVLMGLGRLANFWPQYFSVAFGMAAGSFLTFLFLKLFRKIEPDSPSNQEGEHFE